LSKQTTDDRQTDRQTTDRQMDDDMNGMTSDDI